MRIGRVVAPLLVATLAAGCIVEKPPPETVRATTTLAFALTAEQPVAVRAIRFRAAAGNQAVRSIELSAYSDLPDGAPFRNDVWVSFVDPVTGGLAASRPWAHAGIGGPNGPGPCPLPGCDQTWVVLIRWLSPVPATTVAGSLSAQIEARALYDPRPSEPPFALARMDVTEVPVPEPPPVLAAMATVTGSVRLDLGAGQATPARHVVIRIAADLVERLRAYPNVGRLAFFASQGSDRSSDRVGMRSKVTLKGLDGEPYSGLGGLTHGASEIDLLPLCEARGPCEIPVDIDWTLIPRTDRDTVPPTAFATADWQLMARFETGAGPPIDPAAITIVEAGSG